MIVQELTRIQKRCGFLPAEELRALSSRLQVPLHRLHEVASFYPLYRFQLPPTVDVKVCRDMACHLRGAERLTSSLRTLADEQGAGRIEVGGVSCLGQCDRPVAVSINDHVYRGLDEARIRQHIDTALAGEPLTPQHADRSPCGWKIDVYGGQPRYEAVRRIAASQDHESVLKALETANLRGMGGAGFPTARKWSAVRAAQAPVKYVVCNADESEPGTFKDRELLRRAPYLVIEGMVLAGLVTGAREGYLYIRHEFHEEADAVAEALQHAREQGICGDNVVGSGASFSIELFVSPGGYIQGEETALLEAMEDRRGEPRNKPPFPTVEGLFNRPTVINNVETLAWAPGIVLNGGEWYRNAGVRGAPGMRLVSISGDVRRPGVYEVPFGQTVRELVIDTAGGLFEGRRLKAIAPSGPSGGFLPARLEVAKLPPRFVQEKAPAGATSYDILDLPLDLGTLGQLGSMLGAAFVVYDDRRNMVENALNCVRFFRNESCGKCVPCRMGSEKLARLIEGLLDGRGQSQDITLVGDLAGTMYSTSICGLGQVAANPMASVIKYFRDEVDRFLKDERGH